MRSEDPRKQLGFVHVITGEGPGVHEVSLGYGLRAVGHGLLVVVLQFFKPHAERGEVLIEPRLQPHYRVVSFGSHEPFNVERPTPTDVYIANEGVNYARKLVRSSRRPDLLILDAINPLIAHGLLSSREVIELVDNAPPNVEWMLTGHPVSDEIKQFAHQVIDLRAEKSLHGLGPRRGFDH